MKTLIFFISLLCAPQFNFIPEMKVVNHNNIEEKVPGNKSFTTFLSQFDKVEIPENISHHKIQEYKAKYLNNINSKIKKSNDSKKYLKQFIPELIYGSVSRLGPPIVEPISRYYIDENTIAVTYLVKNRYNTTSFKVNLSIYDLYGDNKVRNDDSKFYNEESITIACLNIKTTTLCDFKAPNIIERTTYKNQWRNDVKEVGLKGNKIVCYNRTDTDQVSISPKGEVSISKLKPALAVVD